MLLPQPNYFNFWAKKLAHQKILLTTIIRSSVVIDRKITQQLMNPVPPELSEVSAGLTRV